jgi:glycerophosphoryl diester phosphodiesterase
VPARLPASAFREGPEFIAHAGGMIDGAIYTNSREAIEQAIRLGHRFIEIDMKATIGGELYGCHSKREFNARTGRGWFRHIPLTVDMVKSVKIDGKFTPIFLREIYDILKDHPDVYLVTDKVTDYDAIIEQFPCLIS